MRIAVNERWVLAGIATLLVPFAAGCGPETLAFSSDTNARSAYMVNVDSNGGNGDFSDTVQVKGAVGSNITRSGNTLSYQPRSQNLSAMNNLTQTSPGTYTGPTGYAQVVAINDVDNNGTADDTFLMFAQNNPSSTSRTEYSYSYGGTRASQSFIDTLKANNHKATYTGNGTFRGAVGNAFVNYQGSLTMAAEFGKADTQISGQIGNLTSYGQPSPVAFDRLTFSGNLTGTEADYGLNKAALMNGGTTVAQDDNAVGAGSFFGPRAGGTIGVLATEMKSGGTNINLIGAYHGSTTDNN